MLLSASTDCVPAAAAAPGVRAPAAAAVSSKDAAAAAAAASKVAGASCSIKPTRTTVRVR